MLDFANTQESYRMNHYAVNNTMNDTVNEQARQVINHLKW